MSFSGEVQGVLLNTTTRIILSGGGIAAFFAVAMGAFGAHALKGIIPPENMQVYQTAVQYHFYHALGLIAVGIVSVTLTSSRLLKWAGALMVVGILLFSGSLYALALTNVRSFGLITPAGGLALLGAWGLFIFAVARNRKKQPERD